jgi:N6-adenosine-specific RNA methylase IME4
MSTIEFHPLANIFPLLEGQAFHDLAEDIKANGLSESILLFEGKILDGRNRYRACMDSGVEPSLSLYDGNDPLAKVISLNLKRRHLDESQRAMVEARIANLPKGANQHSPIGEPSVPQAKVAELLNVGKRSVERAREVLDEGSVELVQAVERGEASVSLGEKIARLSKDEQRQIVASCDKKLIAAAYKAFRAEGIEQNRISRIERIVEISKGNQELETDVRYPIIYADPPWRYEHPPMGDGNRSIENHYPTMSLEEICALPVKDLATEDALLYLWATAPKLAECMKVIEAWGFDYRTSFVWVKDKIGMGYYCRNQHEFLLVARRGDLPPPAPSERVSSVVHGERTEHSSNYKPEKFYDLIENFYPELPKIELFCRSQRKGWAAWGNQANIRQYLTAGHISDRPRVLSTSAPGMREAAALLKTWGDALRDDANAMPSESDARAIVEAEAKAAAERLAKEQAEDERWRKEIEAKKWADGEAARKPNEEYLKEHGSVGFDPNLRLPPSPHNTVGDPWGSWAAISSAAEIARRDSVAGR